MPVFQITVVNDEFVSNSETEAADMRLARHKALKGALDVGSEQLLTDKNYFGCEVIITDGDQEERFLVSLGTSSLKR